MHINVILDREEMTAIITEHLRKQMPNLEEVNAGVPQQTTVTVKLREDKKEK